MNGLRIGFAALRFFDERTGNVESLHNLMVGLRDRGCSPSLLLPRSGVEIELFKGFPVHYYGTKARFDTDIFSIKRAAARAAREIGSNFDLLQLQLPSPAFAAFADRVRRAADLPVVAAFESAFHTSPAVPWPAPGKTLLDLWLRGALNARIHARFARFAFEGCIVASEFQRAELEAAGCTCPIHLIPNSTDCERFAVPPAGTAEPSLAPAGKRVIAYIGHFHFVKGVIYLLQAFELLAQRRSDVHLLVIGSGRGNQSEAVRAGARALGSRASLVERTVDVAALLPRLSALALPYAASYGHQLFPNLVLEGLAAGVPVVTSDIPPVNEIIREGETGHLARPGDAVSLAAALERALREGAGRQAMAERQRRLCRERFDYRVVAGQHLRLYKSLVQGAVRDTDRNRDGDTDTPHG